MEYRVIICDICKKEVLGIARYTLIKEGIFTLSRYESNLCKKCYNRLINTVSKQVFKMT